MRNIILLVIISFGSLRLPAQLKGIIIDSATKKPIENAVVGLYTEVARQDTSYALTNSKGMFLFAAPSTSFSVFVNYVGYRPGRKFRRIYGNEKNIDLGTIALANMAIILDEIVITTPPITVKEDTIEYRGDAFRVKENAVLEDLLKKLPGIQVDKNGNITAQGKAISKVKVNGKEFFGGDPKTATRELPANIIDKIQVIDDYGDQASVSGIKDGESEKILNIQIKKDKNSGYFGRGTAGKGNEGRYNASFNGNYFRNTRQISFFGNTNNTSQSLSGSTGNNNNRSGQETGNISGTSLNGGTSDLANASSSDGISTTKNYGVNYSDQWNKKIMVYGSYSYTGRKSAGYKMISQQNIFSNTVFVNNQENNFESYGEIHRVYFNMEYHIDSFNYIKINPAFTSGTNTVTNKIIFDYSSLNAKTSEGYFNTVTRTKTPNVSGNILFNHKFRKRGRNFSMNVNAGASSNNYGQDSRNNTIQYIPAGNTNLFLYNSQLNSNHSYAIRFTYTEPLSKVKALEFALSRNFAYTGNNKEVYNVDASTGFKNLNHGLSNEYENNFSNSRANISFRTMEKKYNYSLGISLQPIKLEGFSVTKDSGYRPVKRVNVFPVARISFNFSRTKSLTASYRGDAHQPSFSQLQDVIDSSNLQYRTGGNPNLRPSIYHAFNILYNNFNITSGTVLFTNLSISTIRNQIVNNTSRVGLSGAQMTIPQNVNGYYNVNAFYNLSKSFHNRTFIVALNGTMNINNNMNIIDNSKYAGKNWIAGQGCTIEFNHKDWLQLSAGIHYTINVMNYKGGSSSLLRNDRYSSLAVSTGFNIDLFNTWMLKYDFEYVNNKGLTGSIGRNPAIMNATLEKQIFSKKTGILRLQVFDLLNQHSNISRSITGNSIIDARSNRLTRYCIASVTFRLQKFSRNSSKPRATE